MFILECKTTQKNSKKRKYSGSLHPYKILKLFKEVVGVNGASKKCIFWLNSCSNWKENWCLWGSWAPRLPLINIFTFTLLAQYRYLTFPDNIMEAAFFGNSLEKKTLKIMKQLITSIFFSSIIRCFYSILNSLRGNLWNLKICDLKGHWNFSSYFSVGEYQCTCHFL